MNVDSFIKEWWSGSSLDYRHEIREWMKDSYIQPISFWQDLFAQSPKTSIIMEKYDFYSDCILTHVGKGLKAFITGKVTWTYDQINQLIEIQSYVWKSQYNELAPGQTVALFL